MRRMSPTPPAAIPMMAPRARGTKGTKEYPSINNRPVVPQCTCMYRTKNYCNSYYAFLTVLTSTPQPGTKSRLGLFWGYDRLIHARRLPWSLDFHTSYSLMAGHRFLDQELLIVYRGEWRPFIRTKPAGCGCQYNIHVLTALGTRLAASIHNSNITN